MKKSKIFVFVSLGFVITLLVSSFLVYDALFPKAPPIEVPNFEQDMTIVRINPLGARSERIIDKTHTISDGDLILLQKLKDAKPTRIMSANDYPAGEAYWTISYECEHRTYTYYLYESNGIWYAEIPYVGVYKVYY